LSSAKSTQRTWWIRKISSELSVETETTAEDRSKYGRLWEPLRNPTAQALRLCGARRTDLLPVEPTEFDQAGCGSTEHREGNGTDAVVERPSDHCVRRKPVFRRGEASFAEFVSTARQAFNSAMFSCAQACALRKMGAEPPGQI
jgi:hypothetical protein